MLAKHPKPHWRKECEGTPLAGILYCGRCGRVMYAQGLARKAGQKFPNYICSTYHKGRGCGYCFVQQDAILRTVANIIRKNVIQTSLKRLEKAVGKEIERRVTQEQKVDHEAVQRQIGNLDRKIENATERLVTIDASLVSSIEQKLLQMHRDRDALSVSLASPQRPMPHFNPKEVAAKVQELDAIMTNGSPAKVRRRFPRSSRGSHSTLSRASKTSGGNGLSS